MNVTSYAAARRNHSLVELIRRLGPDLARRVEEHDRDDSFVGENYELLRRHRVFSAGIPRELGGGGASHGELCELLQELGGHCSSTALAFSMHSHLVATAVWRWSHGRGGAEMLRRVAAEELVLVSTGASDWLDSSGRLERVDGGYRFTARKPFASGSPAGDVLVTSGRYSDAEQGERVLHFAVSLDAEGVTVHDNWRAHGMRGTGSNDISLEEVFVPESTITVNRPRGEWHPVWSVVLTVALPLIMSAYAGIAARAAAVVRRKLPERRKGDPSVAYVFGEMGNALATTRMAVRQMVADANDYDFEPQIELADSALTLKTIAAEAAIRTVEKAVEILGGAGYFRGAGLERLLRDVRAGHFHPLPAKAQMRFSGRLALGLDPTG